MSSTFNSATTSLTPNYAQVYYMNMNSFSCCTPSSAEFGQVDSLASLLKLVAEPSRLRLLCLLRQGEHCVCELLEHVSMSQSLVSHHLKDLKHAGIVVDEKRGLKVFYSLTPKGATLTKRLFKIGETP
jgi:ArsR family transcriptional regulator, arsenate/arsenite/antimonite-responsive transcriptional repressor